MAKTSPRFPNDDFVRRNHNFLVQRLRAAGPKEANQLAGFIDREDMVRRQAQAFYELDCDGTTEPKIDIFSEGPADCPRQKLVACVVYNVTKRPEKTVAFVFKIERGSCSAVCQERFMPDLKTCMAVDSTARELEKMNADLGISGCGVMRYNYPCF